MATTLILSETNFEYRILITKNKQEKNYRYAICIIFLHKIRDLFGNYLYYYRDKLV